MFGFQINRRKHTGTKELLGWEVYLPHSCDHWEIADDTTIRYDAIGLLSDFIAEAQRALDFLEQTPADWEGHYGPEIDMRFEDSA